MENKDLPYKPPEKVTKHAKLSNNDYIESPSDVFTRTLSEFVKEDDVTSMVETQKQMLSRFEKTNEMLLNFNVLSGNRYAVSVNEFKKHTALLVEMKKDLDSIFKRIRVIKQSLGKQYPDSFKACSDVYDILDEEEEEKGLDSQVDGAEGGVMRPPVSIRVDSSDNIGEKG